MIDPIVEAVVLGVVQGVTEFLPISSDGHLALAQMLFGSGEASLVLTVLLHAGTLLATLIVLRARVKDATFDGVRALARPARFRETPGGRDALVVILASVPTAALGLSLRDAVERWTSSPLVTALGFALTGAVLVSTRFARRGDAEGPSVTGALLIGVAQGLAVMPGLSRSGSTIAAALWLGIRPERAFELSMLMSLPAIFGAVLLEGRHATAAGVPPAAVGAAVAFVVGLGALGLLRRIVVRDRIAWFAPWVFALAALTLLFAGR